MKIVQAKSVISFDDDRLKIVANNNPLLDSSIKDVLLLYYGIENGGLFDSPHLAVVINHEELLEPYIICGYEKDGSLSKVKELCKALKKSGIIDIKENFQKASATLLDSQKDLYPKGYKRKNKKISIAMLVSTIISIAYLIYGIVYFQKASNESDVINALAGMVAYNAVKPHFFAVLFATLINGVGIFKKYLWVPLVAIVAYVVAIFLFPSYFFFVTIQILLCCVSAVIFYKNK